MANDKEPKKTTAYLLGVISSEMRWVKERLTSQNGALDGVKKSVNGLTETLHELPCEIHAERIDALISLADKQAKEETDDSREKRRGRRELLIALIAALVTGGITLLGVWLAIGGPVGG